MMRKCTKCKKNHEGKYSQCKECRREASRIFYEKNKIRECKKRVVHKRTKKIETRLKLYKYLSDKNCIDCGEDDMVVLEFDHFRDKDKLVTVLANDCYPWDRIMQEIEKCEIVCCNCHRRRTYRGSLREKFSKGLLD